MSSPIESPSNLNFSSGEKEEPTSEMMQLDGIKAALQLTPHTIRLLMAKYVKALKRKKMLLDKINEMLNYAEEEERFVEGDYPDGYEEELQEHWRELKAIDDYVIRFCPMIRSQLHVAIPSIARPKTKSADHYAGMRAVKHAANLINAAGIPVRAEDRFDALIIYMVTVLTQIQRIEGTPEGYSQRNIFLLDKAIKDVGAVVETEENKLYFKTHIKPVFDKLIAMLLRTEEANSI